MKSVECEVEGRGKGSHASWEAAEETSGFGVRKQDSI